MSPQTVSLPHIIQGGMGVAVSDWNLARAVALAGQLGVVSGTALDSVLARRLQDGDLGGHIRRALAAFPDQEAVNAIVGRYFIPGGRDRDQPYRLVPLFRHGANRFRDLLTAAANFVEVWLAKESHLSPVGINYLTKIQLPTLPSLYGAMLAGVDYVLMGAGIPLEIPRALVQLAEGQPASLRLQVGGTRASDPDTTTFDPAVLGADKLRRPRFLPIVSSHSLAAIMLAKAQGPIDGFVVESSIAGGHNAPPRGKVRLDAEGQPVYGPRDDASLEEFQRLERPFWLAGGNGTPGALDEALQAGAQGIQVGTLFAFCEESGLNPSLKQSTLRLAASGRTAVRTDPRASPTGFPFKVVRQPGTLSEEAIYQARQRRCDLGYLRESVRDTDGKLIYRCAAEPVEDFIRKGGAPEDTEGRRCLCNALMANVGLGQISESGVEPGLLTSGDHLERLGEFLAGRDSYSAADVIAFLTQRPVEALAEAPE